MRRAARGACRQTRGAPIRLTTTLATVPSVVGVVGLGASGKAAARLALARGARQVRLFDSDADVDAARLARDVTPDGREACVSVHAGPHANHAEAIAACDVVVLSPGVPYARVPVLADAAAADVAVSELSFAARFLPSDMPVVMITGTNGKSTTTAFAAHLAAAALGAPPDAVFAGGNLGTPLSKLAHPDCPQPAAAAVECSSYQLEPNDLEEYVSAAAVVLTTFTPDHLERHRTLRAYAAAKANAIRCLAPTGSVLLPFECAAALADAREHGWPEVDEGEDASTALGRAVAAVAADSDSADRIAFARYGEDPLVESTPADRMTLCGAYTSTAARRCRIRLPRWAAGAHADFDLSQLPCVGAHNRFNAACALFAALAAASPDAPPAEGIVRRIDEALTTAEPPPHRMQRVDGCGTGGAVTFIDDSKATNVESTLAALDSLAGDGVTCVCLLGGQAKCAADGTLGMAPLAAAIRGRHLPAVCFGADGAAIAAELAAVSPEPVTGGVAPTLEEAFVLARASALAAGGHVAVLLSPACASFDAFDNFEHRGRTFQALARRGRGAP